MSDAIPDSIPFAEPSDYFDWTPRVCRLGRGATGAVYKAQCIKARVADGPRAGEWYAVKVIPQPARTRRGWERMLREIAILRHVASPRCVRLFDAFRSDSEVFLVLELVGGGDLFALVHNRGYLSEAEAAHISRQLMEALRDLHTAGRVAHRDLKPENLLVVEGTLQIKIADFGLAKFCGPRPSDGTPDGARAATDPSRDRSEVARAAAAAAPAPGLTLSAPVGTPGYCAPEVLGDGRPRRWPRPVDNARLDVFAAGVIAYALLSGRLPFPKAADRARTVRAMARGPRFPDDDWACVSDDAVGYCRWLLTADPARRPCAHAALGHPWLRPAAPEPPLGHPGGGDDRGDHQSLDLADGAGTAVAWLATPALYLCHVVADLQRRESRARRLESVVCEDSFRPPTGRPFIPAKLPVGRHLRAFLPGILLPVLSEGWAGSGVERAHKRLDGLRQGQGPAPASVWVVGLALGKCLRVGVVVSVSVCVLVVAYALCVDGL